MSNVWSKFDEEKGRRYKTDNQMTDWTVSFSFCLISLPGAVGRQGQFSNFLFPEPTFWFVPRVPRILDVIPIIIKRERPCLTTLPNIEKIVENTTRSRLFLTDAEVFGNVVKHCLECLIYLLGSIETKTKEKTEVEIKS